MENHNYSIIIAWLYPELMSTYGDRGNIIVLNKRCEWRGIRCKVLCLNEGFDVDKLKTADLVFMGGAQDTQQKIVSHDFTNDKVKILKRMIEESIPCLFVCGAYQFLGKYYKDANGNIIKGLGILNLYTENPGENSKRLIGNISIETPFGNIVGFENHGGRTYLGQSINFFGKVIKGFGNNGKDDTEGAIYKNSIGTYLHGPLLPKNPEIADWLIEKALEKKYRKKITLEKLDDSLSQKARNQVLKKI